MMRLLTCFAYYFRGQRILPWICGSGAILIALAIFVSGRAAAPLLALGIVFFAGFPILVGGLAFRQLIGNRRVAMVPDMRYFATGALFLLAVCGAALTGFAASSVVPGPSALHVSLLAFAAISLYLVVSQWVFSHRAGALAFILLPFIVLSLGIDNVPIVWEALLVPWAWVALAGLAWLWLAIAVAATALPRKLLVTGSAGSAWGGDAQGRGYSPSLGGPTGDARTGTSAGTLMRGRPDGWRDRWSGTLMIVLLLPVVMSAVFTLMGVPFRSPETRQFGGEFFLLASFFGTCVFPAMIFAEWPIRLRLLWLRVAGDRAGLWRRLERGLWQELLLITANATVIAAAFLVWSDVQRELIWLYVSGAAMFSLTGSYLGFLTRTSGWHSSVQGLLQAFVMLAFLIGSASLWDSDDPLAVFWLLPLLAILALIFRTLARARFLRMDWCAVRPQRFPRRMI
jgi:hypothetical protein